MVLPSNEGEARNRRVAETLTIETMSLGHPSVLRIPV